MQLITDCYNEKKVPVLEIRISNFFETVIVSLKLMLMMGWLKMARKI